MVNLPFKYNIGDVINMRVTEEAGVKALELEFRFARYVLVMDDEAKMKELVELLVGKLVWPEKKVEHRKTKLPTFYVQGDKGEKK